MITITEGLYTHRHGSTIIVSDQKHMPRPVRLEGKIILMADNLPATKRRLRDWLTGNDLDTIATQLNISRSAAHRLRTVMKINPRGGTKT